MSEDLDIQIERIRRNGRVSRNVIVAATAVACSSILLVAVHEVASRPPRDASIPSDEAYQRITSAIDAHRDACPSGRGHWTLEDRAIEKMLYERLLEVERSRDDVDRDVAAAARRIERSTGEPIR